MTTVLLPERFVNVSLTPSAPSNAGFSREPSNYSLIFRKRKIPESITPSAGILPAFLQSSSGLLCNDINMKFIIVLSRLFVNPLTSEFSLFSEQHRKNFDLVLILRCSEGAGLSLVLLAFL